ncbi:MAG: LysM peptidoglycan-binding domain-containing protein [Lachnospiraceae bacterium]|nr:LysM peptidoglycan-binding domain-containing protein [Lachnospiraceae bacterium]
MFEVSNYKFDADGRLLTQLSYSRNVGSDRYGYSDELFFDRGYQADYDGERLMEELQYIDFWGTNEVGAWEHRIYQYDEHGDCVLKVVTTEDEITLYYYEYDEKAGKVDEYTYQVKEDWELACDDGSIVYFRPQWQSPAVKKVSADGTVEKELFYGKAIDMGQQHYLMPQDVEDTLDDHKYVVKPGDCLWNIAYKYYGHGSYYELLHRVNRSVIGWDENLILPGMRLYIPEAGNVQDTKIRSY